MTKVYRLVNLTSHDVVVDVGPTGPRSSPQRPPSPATIAPSGGMARVHEPVVEKCQLPTEHGSVEEARLRRSDEVVDLPAPRDGVLYVVPRLTAAAARGRDDLLFPYNELRDDQGNVVGVRSLGRFTPARRSLAKLPSVVPSWWKRQLHDVSRIPPVIAVAFAMATGLFGGALGFLPDIVAATPGSLELWLWSVFSIGMLALAITAVIFGWRLWLRRNRILKQRGTAYIIEELAEGWTYEEKRSFLDDLDREFADVLRVPGPADLGADWHWPLGEGADEWSAKVDELVRAFWSVQYNDDQVTENTVFIWAWWSVALAFAGRAVSGRRGLLLRIRRRPSRGREGHLDPKSWREHPISFIRDPALTAIDAATSTWQVGATFASSPADPKPSDGVAGPVTLLLVRMTGGEWGPIPRIGQEIHRPTHLQIRVTDEDLVGDVEIEIREWRCLAEPESFHPWERYHPLAQSAVDWISEVARDRGGVLLLGMLTMQEVAAGMGVLAASAVRDGWPEHLRPVMWDAATTSLVIPGLDLGQTSLRQKVQG